MKKFAFLFLAPMLYAQSPGAAPEITGIQAVNILNDAVVLEWFSTLPAATPDDFVFYYNPTNAIANIQLRDDSRTVRPRNFRSSPQGGLTLYSAEVPIAVSGQFYFAVSPARGLSVDQAIRQNIPLSSIFNLQPEQSYTIQPLAFQLRKPAAVSGLVSNVGAPSPVLIKSLRLSSEEDIFRLTWMVSQNNLTRYTFRIYRSRYPIADIFKGNITRSLETLPVYALVSNRFFFEDRNISFETPYYYAVVADGSAQWNSGLNVFTTPAVLVRKSPPFTISPQQEAVKQTRPFAVQQSSVLTEADIQDAVQQTLSNLMYAPSYINPDAPQAQPPLNTEPLNPGDFLNTPDTLIPAPNAPAQTTLYRGSLLSGVLEADDGDLTEKFYRGASARYNILNQAEQSLHKSLVASFENQEKQFLNGIQSLKSDIFAYTRSAALLAQSSGLGEAQYRGLTLDFLKKRDQIFLKEFTLKNSRQTIAQNKLAQKEALQGGLENLQEKYLQSMEQLKAQYKKSLEVLAQRAESEAKAKAALYNRRKESAARVDNITGRVQNSTGSGFADPIPMVEAPEIRVPALAKFDNPDLFNLPSLIQPSVRLQNMEASVTNEPIPSLDQLEKASGQKEEWLKAKVEWLSGNAQSWQENIQTWNQAIVNLFPSPQEYERLQSTWAIPSMPVSSQTAYSKGKEAFDGARYNEAAYFLVRVPENDNALMMLGQSFYHSGMYKEAVTAFASAYQMKVVGSLPWLLEASKKYTDTSPNRTNR